MKTAHGVKRPVKNLGANLKYVRFIFKLVITFFVRFRWILVLGVAIGLVLYLVLRSVMPAIEQEVIRTGYVGRHHTDDLPKEILLKISEGLTVIDDYGQAQPSLAESWSQSENGKVWTFILKKDKKWHDGTPVTSADIKYTFEDAVIERSDPYTIRFKLENPFAPFPVIVSKPVFKKGLLGTGEWKVDRVATNGTFIEQITLKRQGEDQIIRFYPTEQVLKTSFQLGKIDQMVGLTEKTPFDTWNVVTISSTPQNHQYVAIFFNNQHEPLKNKSVRQALSYAINKTAFAGERTISPIPANSWSYNPQVKPYDYDMTRAQQLLSDIPKAERDQMNIVLTTTGLLFSDAEKIAKDWLAVGIKTTVQTASEVPEDFQAFLAIYSTPEDPDQYQTWHSTQIETNITKFQNPRIDKLLEDGRLEMDFEKRRKIYLDFQRFLLEEAPAVFLYHPQTYTVERK